MKIYLELRDSKSNKFWEAYVKGTSTVVRYGKIGSDGQTKTKDFATEADATAAVEKLANSKRKKGYIDAATARRAKSAPKKSAPKKSAPKKSAPKKSAPKQSAPKKSAPKKSAPKKSAPKKSAPKKSAPKQSAPKKSAPKKSARNLNDRPNLDGPIESPEEAATLYVYHQNRLQNPDLPKCVNARSFEIVSGETKLPSWIRGLSRLRTLSLTMGALTTLPAWLSELTDLRTLTINSCGALTSIPASVWALPRLEELRVFRTTIGQLEGVENAPALRKLTVLGEPLAANLPAIVERIEKASDVTRVTLDVDSIGFSNVAIERAFTSKIPKGTSRAAAAKRAAMLTTLPRGFPCEGIDVSGQSFSDQDIELDLRDANFKDTTWSRCRFLGADMTSSILEGATFQDCFMDKGTKMDSTNAKGSCFRHCELNVSFEGADLRDAVIEAGKEGIISFRKANLKNATMTFAFTSPSKASWIGLGGADLRDASLNFHLTEEEAARVARSRKPATWEEASTTGAKTNAGTDIVYAPLKKTKAPAPTGRVATSVGTLSASNGACWFVVADSLVAMEWGGSKMDDDYNELPGTDFARAMEAEDRAPIRIGAGMGVLGDVGDNGWSDLWKDGDSWCLLYASFAKGVSDGSKSSAKLIGAQVAQLKKKGRANKGGRFVVAANCMTLLIPYAPNPFTAKQIKSTATRGKVKANDDDSALLVPVPNGTYEVTYEDLSHTDDLGDFYTRIRIAPAKSK